MSLTEIDAPGDLELLGRVREGDLDAYGDLFERHVDAARRLASRLAGPARADEIASEAFDRVLHAIQGGKGPTEAFRAYLLTTVRRTAWRHGERQVREHSLDEDPERDEALAGFAPPSDLSAEERTEHERAVAAFTSLPERWQLVLWHTLVEEQSPAEVAPIIGISPNATAALALRAREGLRDAYLQTHVEHEAAPDCRFATERLGALVRSRLSARDTRKVEAHLDECARCRAVRDEVADVGTSLRSIIGPAVLGIPTADYLRSGGGASPGGPVSAASDPTAHSGTVRRVLVGAAALALLVGGLAAIDPFGDDAEPATDRASTDVAAERPAAGPAPGPAPADDPDLPVIAADDCDGTLFPLDLPAGTEVVEAQAVPAGGGAAPEPGSGGLVTTLVDRLDPDAAPVTGATGIQVTDSAVCVAPGALTATAPGSSQTQEMSLLVTLVDEAGALTHAVVEQVVAQVEVVLETVEALAESLRRSGGDGNQDQGGQGPGVQVPDVIPPSGGGSGSGGSTLPGVPDLTVPGASLPDVSLSGATVPGPGLMGLLTPDG